ncbi:ATP-dependent RNA helicase DHX30-like [Galleria mellonella]|uniref:ATP-dependent RNA helicase DHX30-like n=1 Tax=Galleria mellonella TaxID=7137 RepID=A0ABM3MMY5_GALME|nr:ATP-dependent RNA helicase DHX30-like [Galleria mellonella]
MFRKTFLVCKSQFWKKHLLPNVLCNKTLVRTHNYIGLTSRIYNTSDLQHFKSNERICSHLNCLCTKHRYYSNILSGDVTELQKSQCERELKKIVELFPQPRVTLNELTTKTPQKIFEVHYRQISSAPKGRRKAAVNNDWICTYSFIWPEKMKFECTAISKRQAAEKAAIQALHWLYYNKRIDSKGSPIYDEVVLNELRTKLNESIEVSISDSSVERIERIWKDYEESIKDVYEATFKNAKHSVVTPAVLTRDSTIDEDDFSEDDLRTRGGIEVADMSEKVQIHPVYGKSITPPSESTLARRERTLRQKFEEYEEMLTPLPIDGYANQITAAIEKSQVTVIVGAPGCGKSTRAPAAVLKHWGAGTTAIVSEPRRVAAIGLAERVASELGENVGESIGYHVRLDTKPPRPPGGSILYCTSGVLLKRLHANPGLEGCSHVFIDEAHERDVNTDLTLLLLKRAVKINPHLKVIIMSATLDTEVFTRYFDSCPVVDVPGRTFPVEVFHLEDIQKKFGLKLQNSFENCKKEEGKPMVNCQEVAEVIRSVDKTQGDGAILVFLPGWAEIKLTKQILDGYYGQSSTHMILPVHSRLSTTDQTKMFAKPPPGIRKVVLATNIAETSITIPDVVYVVDSGAHKENRIREGTGTESLETVWVSRASAKQRSGRAGRVQSGYCYRLYTKEKEAELALHTMPEILRIPLEQTVLDCKTYAPDDKVEDFLSQLPEPPSKKAIQYAVRDLVDLGALTPSEHVTRLGSLLSSLSLHPRLGCSLLHAAVAGCLVAAANILTHCAENVELFRNAADRREEIREIKSKFNQTSDHAVLHNIQDEFEYKVMENGWRGVDEWCDKYGLRKDRLKYVQSLSNLHLEQLLKSGVVGPNPDPNELSRFSYVDEMLVGIILSGTNSLLTTKKHVRTKGKLKTTVSLCTSKGDHAHISSDSVNYGITKRTNKPQLLAYFGGYHSVERRALVVHKTSLVTPHTALLFCKGDLKKELVNNKEDVTVVSLPRHQLQVHVPTSQADHIVKAKEMLWATFQYYIDRDLGNIEYEETVNVSRFKVRLIKAIGRLLIEAHREYIEGKNREESIEEFS